MIHEGEEIIAVVCGPSKCGKSTLCVALAAWLWRVHKIRSLVYDPIGKIKWGAWCWVTGDLEKFKRAVWNTKGFAVFWDESSDSLDKNGDRKFFTRIRHEHKAIYVICHDFAVLGPLMRGNLTDAYIFRQSEGRAREWLELFADRDLLQTAELQKREYVHKRPFEKIARRLPTLAELEAGP